MQEAKREAGAAPEQKPSVRVFDIPAGATPDETAAIIEKHSSAGYFIVSVLPWPGVGARVFSRQPVETTTPERKQEDVAAEAIIAKYPKLSAGKLADLLAQHGIVRGAIWVGVRRKSLERAATAAASTRREA